MKYTLSAGDYFARRGPVVKHDPEKAPVDCRFCRNGCNIYNYYTWGNRETKRYGVKEMPICFDCANNLEKWAEKLAEKYAGTGANLDEMIILPKPGPELKELMLELDRESRNAG